MRNVFLLIFSVLALSATASAKGNPLQYIITGGVAYPIYDKTLTTSYNAGLHLGIGIGYSLSDRSMLVGSIQVSSLPLDKEEYFKSIGAPARESKAEEGSATVLTGSVNIKYSFSRARTGESLFLTGGILAARFIAGDILLSVSQGNDLIQTVVDGQGKTALGLNAGAGFNIHLSAKSFLFFEARYTVLFTDKPIVHIIPLQMGVAFR